MKDFADRLAPARRRTLTFTAERQSGPPRSMPDGGGSHVVSVRFIDSDVASGTMLARIRVAIQ
jgi:hypothetical protein